MLFNTLNMGKEDLLTLSIVIDTAVSENDRLELHYFYPGDEEYTEEDNWEDYNPNYKTLLDESSYPSYESLAYYGYFEFNLPELNNEVSSCELVARCKRGSRFYSFSIMKYNGKELILNRSECLRYLSYDANCSVA